MISPTIVACAIAAVSSLLVNHAVGIIGNEKCDLYQGSWIFEESYPLYRSENWPFILQQFNCTGNGRPDLQHQKYRWQPHSCDLTMWDGREMVERMGGKRIMLVGDSLSMNQWQSLACIILSLNPNTSYQPIKTTALLSTITFPDLNITLMYLRNALIADVIKRNGTRVLKMDSVTVSSTLWLQADVLIFDTWHWWLYTGGKQPWDLIEEGNVTVTEMDKLEAYEKALRSWGRWVDQNVDVSKIKIFFQGVSPDHWNGSTWGVSEIQRCENEQQPLEQLPVEETGNRNFTQANIVLNNVLSSMNATIRLLDIIKLSQFRVDGHPSIYGNPRHRGMDCTHWCLPGVQDIWNQLLYTSI